MRNILLSGLFVMATFLLLGSSPQPAQDFFRMKADFSIKEKSLDGKSRLTIGTVYYDRIVDKIVYDISFPKASKIIMADTTMVYMIGDSLVDKKTVPPTNRFSVFNLALSGNLNHFGLKESAYQIEKVEKEEDMVITTWAPPEQLADILGKTMISQKNKSLFGVIFFDPEGNLSGKQFFRKYLNVNGLEFPTEVVQQTITEEKDFYKVTTFKNVFVNEMRTDESLYDFPIPD